MNKLKVLGISCLAGLVTLLPVRAEHHEITANIVETAVATESLSTLVTAVVAADLAETLSGPGPFTVFAPLNSAFAEIQGDVDQLLMPENQTALQSVLTYHVVPGAIRSSDLSTMQVETVQGQNLSIEVFDGSVMVNQAHVVIADIETANGVVHVIDKVLLPQTDNPLEMPELMSEMPPEPDPFTPEQLSSIEEIAKSDRSFTALVDALESENLVETLESGEFTVFAPTNEAFNAMPNVFRQALFADDQLLMDVLLAHVVPGTARSSDVLPRTTGIEAVNGSTLNIELYNGTPYVNDAIITQPDVEASNGVIHVIDRVLFPSDIRDRIPKIIGREDRF